LIKMGGHKGEMKNPSGIGKMSDKILPK
jgi:hypothetical protein